MMNGNGSHLQHCKSQIIDQGGVPGVNTHSSKESEDTMSPERAAVRNSRQAHKAASFSFSGD